MGIQPVVKKSSKVPSPRVPPAADGLAVNFCKNPTCRNFGVPAVPASVWGAGHPAPDDYRLTGPSVARVLRCLGCNEYPPVKSNRAVVEERARRIAAITPKAQASCGTPGCGNAAVPVSRGSKHYQA